MVLIFDYLVCHTVQLLLHMLLSQSLICGIGFDDSPKVTLGCKMVDNLFDVGSQVGLFLKSKLISGNSGLNPIN